MLSREQFQEIYKQYSRLVFNTALGYVQNREDAEEITQDVFVEVHSKWAQFEGRASVKTWLYRITINRSLDYLRFQKRKKRFAFLTSLTDQMEPSDFFHPGVAMEQQEQAALLFRLINKLPESQKTAFILSKVEGLSQKEICEVMQRNEGAVESLLSRARDNLRKQIGNSAES